MSRCGFVGELWSLCSPYWTSNDKRRGLAVLGGLLALGWGGIGLSVFASYLDRDLINALSIQNASQFQHLLLLYGAWFVAVVPVYAFYGYINGKLVSTWRDWMTRWLMAANLTHRAYYRISQSDSIDNPDQRISEDVNTFVTSSISLSLLIVSSLITGAAFATILWWISPKLALILFAYAAGGTALSFTLGSRLVGINFNQQRLEADFRFGLVHLRDNAESMALSSGENYELREIGRRLVNVIRNFDRLIIWQRNLSFFTTAYGNSVKLLPYMVLGSTYFTGRIQLGQLT